MFKKNKIFIKKIFMTEMFKNFKKVVAGLISNKPIVKKVVVEAPIEAIVEAPIEAIVEAPVETAPISEEIVEVVSEEVVFEEPVSEEPVSEEPTIVEEPVEAPKKSRKKKSDN
jgi:hypothetical protein